MAKSIAPSQTVISTISSQDIENLFDVILQLENVNEAKAFFRDLLTTAELCEFSNRWKVAHLLNQKMSYTEIEKQTGMSSTTIARISKCLHGEAGGYRLMLEKSEK